MRAGAVGVDGLAGWTDDMAGYLENQGLWDEERDEQLKAKCRDEVNDAVKEAERVPRPELESLFSDVFAEMPKALRDQYEAERTARGEGRFP